MRTILGVLGLHGFLLVIGLSVVWLVRGLATLGEAVRLGGVAYLTGLASYGIGSVILLVVGVPYRSVTMLALGAGIVVVALAGGRSIGRTIPAVSGPIGIHLTLAAAAPAVLLAVMLAALFRQARLEGLFAYDAWWFWVPKAQAISEFGGLDSGFFSSLPGQSYPPLVPALEATAFAFMGSVEPIGLALLMWGFAVGFAWAVVGLLSSRVPALVLWSSLLLLLAAPELVRRVVLPQADVTLDWLVGLAALLVAIWLHERQRWQLVVATLLLAAGAVTKREGLLLAAIVLVAALAATVRDRRRAWPGLVLAAGVVIATSLPWRIWFIARGYSGDQPTEGGLGLLDNLDRVWPSFELALRALFGLSLWPLVIPLALVGVGLAWRAGRRSLATFSGLVFVFSVVGFMWVLWSFPTVPLTMNQATSPIIRLAGAAVVMLGVLTPYLIAEATRDVRLFARPAVPSIVPAGIVAAAVVGYALVVGFNGVPFPSRDECIRIAAPDTQEGVRIIYGRDDSLQKMIELRDQVVAIGFVGTDVRADGCGRWAVAYEGVDTYAQAEATAAEARAAGLAPQLELDQR